MTRKKRKSNTILITILALPAVTVATFYLIRFLSMPPEIEYPGFGIPIPSGYTIHGIDVSRYQRVINWNNVKNMQVKDIKIGFAFIKATEGIGRIDAQFRRNWLKAEEENIPKGAYHFFIAGESGKAQAQNFIDIVKLKKNDLPPVLDIEVINGTDINAMRKEALIWLRKIEKHYKVKPILYTNVYFYDNYLGSDFEDYPLWIAHYLQPRHPRAKRKWIFWQHSEAGRVDGIRHKVDFNIFRGDSADFARILIK